MPAHAQSAVQTAGGPHHARPPSLRLRLTFWMIAIAAAIELILGGAIYFYQARVLDSVANDAMRQRTEPLAALLDARTLADDSANIFTTAEQELARLSPDLRLLALYDGAGHPVVRGSDLPFPADSLGIAFPGPNQPDLIFRRRADNADPLSQPWRLQLRRIRDDTGAPFFMLAGRPDARFDLMLALLRRVLILAFPAGIIAAGISAWLIGGVAVAPVKRLSEVAVALAPETLEEPVRFTTQVAEFEDLKTALEETRERIREAFIARDRFISNVTHELKTPIAIILAEAQTLDRRGFSPDVRVFVRSVIDEMRRLSRTIESFLTLTKVRAGKSLMEHTACSITDVVLDSVLSCSRMARHHRVNLSPFVGEADPPRVIVGDPELLRVMLDNLIRNAIRFSPEGASVTIHVTEAPSECTIAVRDHGPGIPAGILGSVFEPLVQAPEESDRGRGLGLGLSIAQAIAELHTGKISACNLTEGGCEIVARLPCEAALVSTPAPN